MKGCTVPNQMEIFLVNRKIHKKSFGRKTRCISSTACGTVFNCMRDQDRSVIKDLICPLGVFQVQQQGIVPYIISSRNLADLQLRNHGRRYGQFDIWMTFFFCDPAMGGLADLGPVQVVMDLN